MMTKDHKIGTTVFIVFIVAIIFVWLWIPAKGVDDLTPACNLWGIYTPSDTTSAWFDSVDARVDYQTHGSSAYDHHFTRKQPRGTYLEMYAAYEGQSQANDLRSWFSGLGIHPDSAFAHFSNNTYYRTKVGTSTFTPGWNPTNDANNNWVRDYNADYDWNGDTTRFTVQRTSAPYYIQDAGGGRMGSWTNNQWQNAYLKMGWNADADTFATTVDSNHVDTLYLNSQPPLQTYLWYIVDNPSAPDHNAVAMYDSLAHWCHFYNGFAYVNFKDTRVRQWAGHFTRQYTDEIANHRDSLGIDSIGAAMFDDADKRSYEVQNKSMGGASLEGYDTGTNFFNWMKGLYDAIRDSASNAVIYGNISNYGVWYPSIDTLCQSMNGFLYEGLVNVTQGTGDFNTMLNSIKRQRNAFNYNLAFIMTQHQQLRGSTDENKMACLAAYDIIKDDSTYFYYCCVDGNYGVNYRNISYWFYDLMKVDIGTPTDTAIYDGSWSSGGLWTRPFSNGFVALTVRDASASYYDSLLVSLGGYYYPLDVNGDTVGADSVNQIYMQAMDGFVGIKPSGETPPAGTHILFRK